MIRTHFVRTKVNSLVICGKYINLNKITKIKHISLKFYRLLIFVILYSLQCKIEGYAVKKVFYYGKIKGNFCARKSKEIASLMKMRSTLNVP